jgi:hypothetical protein
MKDDRVAGLKRDIFYLRCVDATGDVRAATRKLHKVAPHPQKKTKTQRSKKPGMRRKT